MKYTREISVEHFFFLFVCFFYQGARRTNSTAELKAQNYLKMCSFDRELTLQFVQENAEQFKNKSINLRRHFDRFLRNHAAS